MVESWGIYAACLGMGLGSEDVIINGAADGYLLGAAEAIEKANRADRSTAPTGYFLHFKGGIYRVHAPAEDIETGERKIVYENLKPGIGADPNVKHNKFIMPAPMFFSEVDHDKYPEVELKYRFTRLPEGIALAMLQKYEHEYEADYPYNNSFKF